MKNKFYSSLMIAGLCISSHLSLAQVAAGYEVATWYQFKSAAVSYTFDDNTPKQLSVALPLFDTHDFKATFYPVTGWGPNWPGFKSAYNNGHEIGSHTVSHPGDLGAMSVAAQEEEYTGSRSVIKSNTGADAVTLAYPNCRIGDLPTIKKYFIAGRICDNQIASSSPSDMYRVGAIIVGDESSVNTVADFTAKLTSAKNSRGWAVFLMHGIDQDGGFSELPSPVLSDHLNYVKENIADYWVGTFGNVAKYIRERNALSVVENAISADYLEVVVTDNLDDNIYNVPVTIRREIPATWADVRVFMNNEEVSPLVVADGAKKYVVLNIIPDQDEVYLANTAGGVISGIKDIKESSAISIGANPFSHEMNIRVKGDFSYSIHTMEGKVVEKGLGNQEAIVGAGINTGIYLLVITHGCVAYKTKIIKRK